MKNVKAKQLIDKRLEGSQDDFYDMFPNLRRFREAPKEIARSVLNNGWFTIAQNWTYKDKSVWEQVFKELGASSQFMNELDYMFESLESYENPKGYDDYEGGYVGPDEVRDDAWEEMIQYANNLDRMADREGLTDKLRKMIGW